MHSPKNLWNDICLFLCVPVGTFWCFLNVFTAVCQFWCKGLLNLWEVKISGWFTHIGYKRTRFRISCAWYGHSVQKDWSPPPSLPSIDTSLLLIWLPSYFIFFPNPRFLARLFRQWWPFFIFRRDFWQRFFRQYCPFFIFRRLKNNVICFFLQR